MWSMAPNISFVKRALPIPIGPWPTQCLFRKDYQGALARRLEDKEPAHWLTPDQFERELDKQERQ